MRNEDVYSAIVALKEATEIGFERTDSRLDGIDTRLGRVESHLLRLETRVEAVEDGLSGILVDVAALSKRLR